MRAMMGVAAVVTGLLAGCDRTPSFDERYDQKSKDIAVSAGRIETEVANQMAGAREADRALSEAAASVPAGNQATVP